MDLGRLRLEVPNGANHKVSFGVFLGLLVCIYVLTTSLTGAHFMADTKEYVRDILSYEREPTPVFWDFGHLFWRPLGAFTFVLIKPILHRFMSDSEFSQIAWDLIILGWVSGLICVVFLLGLSRRFINHEWVAFATVVTFLFSDAVLNYVHAGTAYMPGLACLVTGMWLLVRERRDAYIWRVAVPAAASFAGAVLLWFPYVFALPAALTLPFFIKQESTSPTTRVVRLTLLLCVGIGIVSYGVVILNLGIRSVADLKAWIFSAGHGQMQTRGLARLAISLPRSFINLGSDGVLFKRYLLHDPYAPVTLIDLVRLSFWKIIAFYLFLGALSFELLRSRQGRRILVLLLLATLPTFYFALIIFEAGSIERYLPIAPFCFLAAGYALGNKNSSAASKAIIVLWFAAVVLVNFRAMQSGVLNAKATAVVERISPLRPLLKMSSIVMTVDVQEDVSEFKMNFPLDTRVNFTVYNVLEISAERLFTWREDFAQRVILAWEGGGDVWLSRRLFQQSPLPQWNWVEGADKRIHWSDMPAFFCQFDIGPTAGGSDGFALLRDSAKNRSLIGVLASQSHIE